MSEALQTIERMEVAPNNNGSMSIKQISDRVNLVHQVLEKVMRKDTHYGTVPGCGSKMVLLKPGADVLAMTFRLVPQFRIERNDLDDGHREYDVTCSMFGPDGSLLGQGVGSASTMEKKYRYRWDNGVRVENDDIADVYNTVLKIAKKRAHIDATMTVTGAADIFTQDLIDEDDAATPKPEYKQPVRKAAHRQDAPAKALTVTGIVEGVEETHGEKNGKPWTKYGIKIDGQFYGTFHESLAGEAKDAEGQTVELTYENKGKYNNAVSLRVVDDPDAELESLT